MNFKAPYKCKAIMLLSCTATCTGFIHIRLYTRLYISPSGKGKVVWKILQKKEVIFKGKYKNFNLSLYKNISPKPSLGISFGEQVNPWSKFMEGDQMVEHDTVFSIAGADSFSIFRMSIVVLSFRYIKKRTLQ